MESSECTTTLYQHTSQFHIYPSHTDTMNTIAPPPKPPTGPTYRVPAGRKALGIFIGLLGGGVANLAMGYTAFNYYSRNTEFVPYDTTSPDFQTATFKKHNPTSNPPVCIDHAIRKVPLSDLKTRDQAKLTTEFCRGVWSGMGYAYQRRYLEKKYRALPGRENHLWERSDLKRSSYKVGTKITDHFEVVEHTPEKVGYPHVVSTELGGAIGGGL